MTEDLNGLTVKELVLRLDAKVDAYLAAHAITHSLLIPSNVLNRQIEDLSQDVRNLGTTVSSHERTLQRIVGALILVSALGIGTLLLVFLRLIGIAA